jgi:hypothetical protein
MKPKTLIPGHGPVSNLDSVKLMQRYIQHVERLAEKAFNSGKPVEKLANASVPASFASWDLPRFFGENLRFLYQRLAGRQSNDEKP